MTGISSRAPIAALGLIASGLGALIAFAVAGDRQLSGSIEVALQESGPRPMVASPVAPIAGNEDFWLNRDTPAVRQGGFKQAAWGSGISIGDRFMFGGGNGGRVLQVQDVRRIDLSAAERSSGAPQARLHITLRDVADSGAPPIELLVAADAPIAGLTPLRHQAPHDL